jgi:MFS family permease
MVVFVMFLAMSMVSVTRASIGLAMPSLEQDMGWSRSFLSTLVACALVTMAIMGPFVGNLLDRFGARRILLSGLLVTACALLLTSQADSVWQILVAYSLIGGIGFGLVSKNVAAATIARHFEANRGLAVGVANAGSTAGHIAILPVMAIILTAFGWRWGYLFLAGISVLLLPVVWFLIKPGADVVAPPRSPGSAPRRATMIEEDVPDTLFCSGTGPSWPCSAATPFAGSRRRV